jgi:hypothetical protein
VSFAALRWLADQDAQQCTPRRTQHRASKGHHACLCLSDDDVLRKLDNRRQPQERFSRCFLRCSVARHGPCAGAPKYPKEPLLVENLQREDIHPLEESLGFKSLLQLGEPSYTIASIAARAGKSEAYVYGLCC